MDNVSRNGEKLREAVLEISEAWAEKGYVPLGFLDYVRNEGRVAFPWTMIDKITPRPSERIADMLRENGVEHMEPVINSRKTSSAPFVNAEAPQDRGVEDRLPNGRPPLEKAGV